MKPMQLLLETLRHNPMEFVWPLIVLALTFLAGLLVRRLVLRALEAWSAHAGSRPGAILATALRGPTLIWAIIAGVHFAIQTSSLPARVAAPGAKILLVLWMISLTLMSMRLAGALVRHYGNQVPGALPVTGLTQTLAQLAVVALGILLILSALDFRITPILTALGVGGLAVALALQDTLSNLFSGFYVAVAGQIRLGDYIRLNTGEEGYVADIGWRTTTVRSLANNMVLIPNAKLAQAIVTNFHLPEKRLSVSLPVSVRYDADPDHIEAILQDLLRAAVHEIPEILADPAPSVTFDPGFGEFSLGFTVGFQVGEFSRQFAAKAALRKRILRRFREEGIVIPLPARTVYLEGASTQRSGDRKGAIGP
jgi:small-conductance mechanosensitive channel